MEKDNKALIKAEVKKGLKKLWRKKNPNLVYWFQINNIIDEVFEK